MTKITRPLRFWTGIFWVLFLFLAITISLIVVVVSVSAGDLEGAWDKDCRGTKETIEQISLYHFQVSCNGLFIEYQEEEKLQKSRPKQEIEILAYPAPGDAPPTTEPYPAPPISIPTPEIEGIKGLFISEDGLVGFSFGGITPYLDKKTSADGLVYFLIKTNVGITGEDEIFWVTRVID